MLKIAIIVSEFNHVITSKLLEGAEKELIKIGLLKDQIKIFYVPGAIEIPLTAKLLAKTGNFDAIIALGCVIRGETSHYDYVCKQVSDGCQQVMMEFEVPVIFGVLTTENEEQALARAGGTEGNKGRDAAEAAITMIKLVEQLTVS